MLKKTICLDSVIILITLKQIDIRLLNSFRLLKILGKVNKEVQLILDWNMFFRMS